MCNEQSLYISPLMNWRIITCEGLWGISKYEVEFWNNHFWESRFDGEGNLKQCFSYLYKINVISMDEKRFQINKWCNKTAILS